MRAWVCALSLSHVNFGVAILNAVSPSNSKISDPFDLAVPREKETVPNSKSPMALRRDILAKTAGNAAKAALDDGHSRVSIDVPLALLKWGDKRSICSTFEVLEWMLREVAWAVAGGRGCAGGMTPLGQLGFRDAELKAGKILKGDGVFGYHVVDPDGVGIDVLASTGAEAPTAVELDDVAHPTRSTVFLNCGNQGRLGGSFPGVVPAFVLERLHRSRRFVMHEYGGEFDSWEVSTDGWKCVGSQAKRPAEAPVV